MSVLVGLLPTRRNRQGHADQRGFVDDGWSVRRAWRWFVVRLADYHWYLLAVVGAAAFILGCIGWWKFTVTGHGHPVSGDGAFVAYWSFKDFLMNSPVDRIIPWQLNVARFLAPIVAGWVGLSTLSVLFRDRVQQMKIPLMHGRVVICGLGKYVGIVFLRHLRDKRIPVVVIELDPANPSIELCRSLGVPVIVGDAQRLRTLQAAGAHRARRVLAVTDDDAVNTQIVATWRELPGRRPRQLGCLARIADPEFCRLLRIQELQRGDPEMSVDFFNIDEISARLLLEAYPFNTNCPQPHILVAHLDPLGDWLVYHAAQFWCDHRGGKTDPLVVTVLDDQPDERITALRKRYPELEKEGIWDFKPYGATPEDIHKVADHHRNSDTPPISRAYVTAYHDQQAFETALQLHHESDLGQAVPVVIALSRPHGVAALLGDVKKAGTMANVEVFRAMEETCTVELVLGGSFEPMAHAIHERWRQQRLEKDLEPTSWADLDDSRKESNRAQARDIPVKLRMIGCAIAPLRNWNAKDFKFTPAEVEKLAIEEHERWNRERIADGWTLTTGKADADRKKTPYLLPWQQLKKKDPEIANYDVMFVMAIPHILASVGLQVIPTPARHQPQATEAVPS
jgi:voltage-gated potassium channel Kch